MQASLVSENYMFPFDTLFGFSSGKGYVVLTVESIKMWN